MIAAQTRTATPTWWPTTPCCATWPRAGRRPARTTKCGRGHTMPFGATRTNRCRTRSAPSARPEGEVGAGQQAARPARQPCATGRRRATVRRTRGSRWRRPVWVFVQVRALQGGRFDPGGSARVTSLRQRDAGQNEPLGERSPGPLIFPPGPPRTSVLLWRTGGKHKPRTAAQRLRIGVRVSFENSTVCRACLFGLVVLCQFDVLP